MTLFLPDATPLLRSALIFSPKNAKIGAEQRKYDPPVEVFPSQA
jgi:hypothetical protein